MLKDIVKGIISKCTNFEAYIKVDGKKIHLGLFDKEKDAKEAYHQARLKYFGEFAPPR